MPRSAGVRSIGVAHLVGGHALGIVMWADGPARAEQRGRRLKRRVLLAAAENGLERRDGAQKRDHDRDVVVAPCAEWERKEGKGGGGGRGKRGVVP